MLGTVLSHYRVVGKLGVGGMGVVYDAEDLCLPRRVALKFLPEELARDGDALRRLQREAETIALLNHPNICTIYEIGEHEGTRFIVMERVNGTNLTVYMAHHALGEKEIVEIARQVASALDAAHSRGIVHRDVKPGNIVAKPGPTIKLLDFGLARRFKVPETGEVSEYGSTLPGRPIGTPNYMSPERILQGPHDPRSDLFSLGVIMYEMATGRLPFAGDSQSETVSNVFWDDPVPLRRITRGKSAHLERVVARLLAKVPQDRFQSAGELLAALDQKRFPKNIGRFSRR